MELVYTRFKLLTRKQSDSESYELYHTALKKLSKDCELKDFESDLLLVVLLMGVKDEKTRETHYDLGIWI